MVNPVSANVSAMLGGLKLAVIENSVGEYIAEGTVNLSHGDYRLKVKAYADNSIPAEEEVIITVHSKLPEVDLSTRALQNYFIISIGFALIIAGTFFIYNMWSSGGRDLEKSCFNT